MLFSEFLPKANSVSPNKYLLALDPGETTGWAFFIAGELQRSGQLQTHTIKLAIPRVKDFFEEYIPYGTVQVVFEDYRVYGWKTESHAFSSLHTPQLLGVIETWAFINGWKTHRQMAQQPKQFCTDAKLREWGYYKVNEKHARDAIRHGCYYLLFNNKPVK